MNYKNNIGGFTDLMFPSKGTLYHDDAIALHSGRQAFEWILDARHIEHLYIPYYICGALVQVLERKNILYTYYQIDRQLLPMLPVEEVPAKSVVLYLNYFGICDAAVRTVTNRYKNVMIDNSQSFFSMPIEGIDTFYSPRKFFGVPDGGYAYTVPYELDETLSQATTYKDAAYLLARADGQLAAGYELYKQHEALFETAPLQYMSQLSKHILHSVAYEWVAHVRRDNFTLLHERLGELNQLQISNLEEKSVPLCYPLQIEKGKEVKEVLIAQGIFIPTYWEFVHTVAPIDSYAVELANTVLALPIDERYNEKEMERILSVLDTCM